MKLTKLTSFLAMSMAVAIPSAAMLSTPAVADDMPTVTLMVGGIDKQIYPPYQLAQGLGMYKKYGVNVELSTEQSGGVGAEDALISGQLNMAGAWYNHTIEFQEKGNALVATLVWMRTHTAADVANAMPADFVSNQLTSKDEYIAALTADWSQFNIAGAGTMPESGPKTVNEIERAAGKIAGTADLSKTFTNEFVDAAKKLEGVN